MFLLCWFFHFVTVISTILNNKTEMSVRSHASVFTFFSFLPFFLFKKKKKKKSPPKPTLSILFSNESKCHHGRAADAGPAALLTGKSTASALLCLSASLAPIRLLAHVRVTRHHFTLKVSICRPEAPCNFGGTLN